MRAIKKEDRTIYITCDSRQDNEDCIILTYTGENTHNAINDHLLLQKHFSVGNLILKQESQTEAHVIINFVNKITKFKNLVTIRTLETALDSYDIYDNIIDLSKYVYFTLEERLGDWYILGHRPTEEKGWCVDSMQGHKLYDNDVAKFVYEANKYGEQTNQSCKVSKFNTLHYSRQFYTKLRKLLYMVDAIKGIKNDTTA